MEVQSSNFLFLPRPSPETSKLFPLLQARLPSSYSLTHRLLPAHLRTNTTNVAQKHSKMGKNNKKRPGVPEESQLLLVSTEASKEPVVDTHTHLLSTFSAYRGKYTEGKYESVFDFVRGAYEGRNVAALVDVYCEAPVEPRWRELADSALTEESRREKWNGIEYWFVMGESCVCLRVVKCVHA